MPSNNADRPFNSSAKADTILRSSDKVDFFVLKSLLTLVSPVFDEILSQSLNERETKESTDEITLREDDSTRRSRFPGFNLFVRRREAKANNDEKNGLPIQLEEDSKTLYNLLLLIYPYSKEPPNTVEVYLKVGAAARKYGMVEVEKKLMKTARRDCVDALVKQPLRAYAIASHFRWDDVKKIAARNTLKFPLGDLQRCDELRLLSGVEYHELVQWRLACRDAMQSLLAKWESQTSLPECRIALTRLLREKLEATDCPWIIPDIEAVSGILAENASPSPLSYSEVKKNCGLADVEIDKVLSTVRRRCWLILSLANLDSRSL